MLCIPTFPSWGNCKGLWIGWILIFKCTSCLFNLAVCHNFSMDSDNFPPSRAFSKALRLFRFRRPASSHLPPTSFLSFLCSGPAEYVSRQFKSRSIVKSRAWDYKVWKLFGFLPKPGSFPIRGDDKLEVSRRKLPARNSHFESLCAV